MKTAETWLEISKKDIQVAEILYESSHFNSSYFHFQQATEKANKALFLVLGIISEEDFQKKISHDQLRIFQTAIKKHQTDVSEFINKISAYSKDADHELIRNIKINDHAQVLENDLRLIDSLRNSNSIDLSIEELDALLEQLNSVKNIEIFIPDNSQEILEQSFLKIIDWVSHFDTPSTIEIKKHYLMFLSYKESFGQFHDIIIKEVYPLIKDMAFLNLTLCYCSIITNQANSSTRYPFNNQNPNLIYTKQLPIVQKQPQFMEMFREALIIAEKYIIKEF